MMRKVSVFLTYMVVSFLCSLVIVSAPSPWRVGINEETDIEWGVKISPPSGKTMTNYEFVTGDSPTSSQDKTFSIACPSGKRVIGGGCYISGADPNIALQGCYPDSNLTSWNAIGVESDPTGTSWYITINVICANV